MIERMIHMNFSQTLKALREERQLTQELLASYLGLARSTVAGYETKPRQPDFETLQKLASYFEVSIDFLIAGETPSTLPKSAPLNENGASLDSEMEAIYQQLSDTSKYDLLRYAKLLQLHETRIQGSKEK